MNQECRESFSFQFELGQAEHVRATRIIYNRRWSTRALYVVLLIFTVVLALLWLSGAGTDDPLTFTGSCGLVGAATAAYLGPFFAVRGIRKKSRSAAGPYVYLVGETGIDVQAPGVSLSILWANVVEVYETSAFLLFYVSTASAMLLPKRIVRDDELPSLKAALGKWVGEKVRLKP